MMQAQQTLQLAQAQAQAQQVAAAQQLLAQQQLAAAAQQQQAAGKWACWEYIVYSTCVHTCTYIQ